MGAYLKLNCGAQYGPMFERAVIMKGSRMRHIRGWRFSEFMLPVLIVMFNRAHVRIYIYIYIYL